MERVGDWSPYFTTEKSDLAKATRGIGGTGSLALLSLQPRLPHPLAKSRGAAAASLLKEEKMSRAINTLAAGHKLITS